MSNWVNKIDLSEHWAKANDNPELLIEICKIIVKELKSFSQIPESLLDDKEELTQRFEGIIEEHNIYFDDFNDCFKDLYDFCDISLDGMFAGKKIAWIKTWF